MSAAHLEPVEARVLRLADQLDASHAAERHTRMSLLRIHAWVSVLAGLLMMTTGTAQIFETTFGTWSRAALGGLAVVAGAVLLAGIRQHRAFVREIVGLALVGLWDVFMAVGFVLSIAVYGSVQVRWPWDLNTIDTLQPRPYGPVIYFGLAAMVTWVHLRAVLRDRRSSV